MPTKKRGNKKKPSGEELQDVFNDLSKDVGRLIRRLTQSGTEFFKKLGETQEHKRKPQKEPSGGLENLFKQFGAAFKETFGPLGFAPKPEEAKPTRAPSKPKSKRERKK